MDAEIKAAVETMRNGGTVLYPTETIWGVGCDATNSAAVQKVSKLKGRAAGKSYVCLVANDGMLQRYVPDIPEVAWELLDAATKPLTLILPDVQGLAPETVAEDGSCAFRMAHSGIANKLVHRFGKPIVSTSANISGNPFPTKQSDIDPHILNGVDYPLILPPDPPMTGKPSSIIKLGKGGLVEIIRE